MLCRLVTRLRGAASVTGARGLYADGAGRGDGQRGEDDGAELLTRGPGKQGAAGRGRGGGRAERLDWAGWVSAQAETSSFFFYFQTKIQIQIQIISKNLRSSPKLV